MRTTRGLPLTLALTVVACGLLACGGGDGSSGPALLLSGTYHIGGVTAETNGGPQFATMWGTLAADGFGTLSLTTWRNENYTSDGMADTEMGIPYTVDGDRTVRVLDASTPSVAIASGRIAAAGDVVVLSSASDGQEPGLWIAIRKGGTFAANALEGQFHGCMVRYESAGKDTIGYNGSFVFDGAGTFTGQGNANVDGALSPFNRSGTYSVSTDGSVELDFTQWVLRGGMLEDGRLAVLAGSARNGEPPALLVLIRKTPTAEDWDLAFEGHHIAGLERQISSLHYRSYGGGFEIAMDGSITVAWDRNDEGTVTPLAPWSGTWGLDPDASFGFFDAGGAQYVGGLEQSGRYAVCGGGRNASSEPALYFLVR